MVIISDSEEETKEFVGAEEIIANNKNNKIDKCFQIGPCYLLNQLYAKQSEVENFKLLEMMLGPEEEEEKEEDGGGVDVGDPDWSYLDENVGVEVGGRDAVNHFIYRAVTLNLLLIVSGLSRGQLNNLNFGSKE